MAAPWARRRRGQEDEVGGGEVSGVETARRPQPVRIAHGDGGDVVGGDEGGDLRRQRAARQRDIRPDAPGEARQEGACEGGRRAQLSAPMACSSVSSRAPERTSSRAGLVWFGM